MKRFLLLASMLMLCVPAFASVGIQDDGTDVGQATNLNIKGETTATFDGSTKEIDLTTPTSITTAGDITFKTSLLAIGRGGASTTVASSSTNLAPSNLPWTYITKFTAGANSLDQRGIGTNLPNGTKGQLLTFELAVCGTNGAWVITPKTCTGFSKFTMDTAGDITTLLYVDDYIGWIIFGNSGSTVTVKYTAAPGFANGL